MSTDLRAWPFREAETIVEKLEREAARGIARPHDYILLETGYGPSGLPHIGTFAEVARTTARTGRSHAATDTATTTRSSRSHACSRATCSNSAAAQVRASASRSLSACARLTSSLRAPANTCCSAQALVPQCPGRINCCAVTCVAQ